MEKQTSITAPTGTNYLHQFMTDLPYNCLLNKGLTGCGATELALRNDIPTIIAMPFVALIENKESVPDRPKPIFGVYSGVTTASIAEYARTTKCLKIATTYDSLPKVIKALEMTGINVFKDIFLLVDEWHVLFNSYVFRRDAIKGLLDIAAQFSRVTYMTATPIEREYILDELTHLPTVEIV